MLKRQILSFLLVLLCVVLLSACGLGGTGDTRNDPAAAQSFLPVISGYRTYDVDSLADALTAAGVGGSAITGNLLGSAAFVKLNGVIQCYQDVGAATAQIYLPTTIDPTQLQTNPPATGVVAVVNETRLGRNLISCLTGAQGSELSAQAAAFEPCVEGGRFTFSEENISYVFAGTTPALCDTLRSHFARYTGG